MDENQSQVENSVDKRTRELKFIGFLGFLLIIFIMATVFYYFVIPSPQVPSQQYPSSSLPQSSASYATATILYNKCTNAINKAEVGDNVNDILIPCQEAYNYFQANKNYINTLSSSGTWADEVIAETGNVITILGGTLYSQNSPLNSGESTSQDLSLDTSSDNSGNIAYSYWKGDFPITIYAMESEERKGEIKGISFMVLKYDRISNDILDVQFGMVDATQRGEAVAVPELDYKSVEGYDKLGLDTPVIIFTDWSSPFSSRNKKIVNGVNSFSFNQPSINGGYTEWSFTHTTSLMTGTVKNFETVFGWESDTNVIKLTKVT